MASLFNMLIPALGAGAEGYMQGQERGQQAKTTDILNRLQALRLRAERRKQQPVDQLYPGLTGAAISDRPTLAKAQPNLGGANLGEFQDVLSMFETTGQQKQQGIQAGRNDNAADRNDILAVAEIRKGYADPVSGQRAVVAFYRKQLSSLQDDIAQGNVDAADARGLILKRQMTLADEEAKLKDLESQYGQGVLPAEETLRTRNGLGGGVKPKKPVSPKDTNIEY